MINDNERRIATRQEEEKRKRRKTYAITPFNQHLRLLHRPLLPHLLLRPRPHTHTPTPRHTRTHIHRSTRQPLSISSLGPLATLQLPHLPLPFHNQTLRPLPLLPPRHGISFRPRGARALEHGCIVPERPWLDLTRRRR